MTMFQKSKDSLKNRDLRLADLDDNDELAGLKRWWAANGKALIIGVLVALVALGGWYGWGWYQNRQAAQAANSYVQIEQGIHSNNVTGGVVHLVDKLKNHYAGTPYAAAAALDMAAFDVHQKHYAKAAAQLDWVVNNANNAGIRNIARVRAARLLWTRNKPQAALKLLGHDHPHSFDALYAELAGDIHAAQGQRTAAYKAYQRALASLPPNIPRQPLQSKMSGVAPAQQSKATPAAARSTGHKASSSS